MANKKLNDFNMEGNKDFSTGISTYVDWEPRTNIMVLQNEAVIEMELPGVKQSNIKIDIKGTNELIIRGVKIQPRYDTDESTYVLFEREFGRFYKRVIFDFQVETEGISTRIEQGVLIVRLPKKEKKKIQISIEEGDQNG